MMRTDPALSNLVRYERIARFYDLLDVPFEHRRYRRLRPLLFQGIGGRVLDAGVGTGRNVPFYPAGSTVIGVDFSPAMLARARRRLGESPVPVDLMVMDVTELDFPADMFDAAVATFLFCVLPNEQQTAALRELRRVVKPGGDIRLLEYVRPKGLVRRLISHLWGPWITWAYGASFDRNTEAHVPEAGLDLIDSRFVVADLVKLIIARVPTRDNAGTPVPR